MGVVGLLTARSCIPHLDRPIFRTGHHPLSFAMKGNPGDVVRVAVKGHDGVRVRRLDIVKFDIMMACGCEVPLIGGDTQAIHLGIWMLNRAGAYAR